GRAGPGRERGPAEPPAGHQEALREAVDDDQAVVGIGDVEKAGGGGAGPGFAEGKARCRRYRLDAVPEIDPLVDLVGDDPRAGRSAVLEQHALLVARER